MNRYCVQVSPQTSQPFSRASAIGSTDRLAGDVDDVERRSRRRARAGRRGSSPRASVSVGRVRACQIGSVLPSATASLTMTSIASPFSACTITSAPVSAAVSIVLKSVSSSTMTAPL